MRWFLAFHIVFFIIWAGALLDLTRILGYHVKEELPVQQRLSAMEFRMFWFVATPGMVVTILMGLFAFFSGGGVQTYFGSGALWFHIKITFVLLLISVHFLLGKNIMKLRAQPEKLAPGRFKALHGLTGVFLIAIIIMVMVRPF
ncbi:MAG: CopD family protein [Deltaproteobacteria bacterium]|nr:CopD family protein [Deltaproteobacteria bacterium]